MVDIRCVYPRDFKIHLIAKIEADLFRSAFCFRDEVVLFGKSYLLKNLLCLSYNDSRIFFKNSLLVKCLVYNRNYRFIVDIMNSYNLNLGSYYLEYLSKK